MPACLWAQEEEMDFVKSHLGPTLRNAGMPTKIWVLDHNYSLWGRAIDELSDPGAYEYIDGIAWHGYVGEPARHDPRARRLPAEERLLDRRRPGHQPARLSDRLHQVGRHLQRHCKQLGAVHHVMEHRARREGQAEHRPLLLRRRDHRRKRQPQGHAQRPVLGLRALLQTHQARRKGFCHRRHWLRRPAGGSGVARRLPQPRWQHRCSPRQSAAKRSARSWCWAIRCSKSICLPTPCTRCTGPSRPRPQPAWSESRRPRRTACSGLHRRSMSSG